LIDGQLALFFFPEFEWREIAAILMDLSHAVIFPSATFGMHN
jgi:hypothetical protein